MKKIAILSNVNMSFVGRKLKKEFEVWATEGYGNELGILLNPTSTLHSFAPEVVFLLMDLGEMIGHADDLTDGEMRIAEWFAGLESAMKDEVVYYVSDGYLFGEEVNVDSDPLYGVSIEALYHRYLQEWVQKHGNARVFSLRKSILSIGIERSFSMKTWYLGKILFSNELQGMLAETIMQCMDVEYRTAKKVLVLDLDNTLWGGLAGDYPETDVQLSEDHEGLIYKNIQRVIRKMKDAGVILCIASKNNEADAMKVIEEHPHMILRRKDFAAYRINWNPKDQSLRELAKELNVGLDSFVFWDDQPAERALIKEAIPEVTVPDFPEDLLLCGKALTSVYEKFFQKPRVTAEDRTKTESYAQNRERKQLENSQTDYTSYLQNLDLRMERVDERVNSDRLLQLFNKTNQFNLTTRRFDLKDCQEMLASQTKRVFLYRVEDRFGDYGIVAAVVVDVETEPQITDFVMSCRVMGKKVEYAIISEVEKALRQEGFTGLRGRFIPTSKNMPVENLYEELGYTLLTTEGNGEKEYRISLEEEINRSYYVTVSEG